jgi:hypothetical protein
MTNQQQTNQPQSEKRIEDRKAQKLLKQIEMKLACQAKVTRDKAA